MPSPPNEVGLTMSETDWQETITFTLVVNVLEARVVQGSTLVASIWEQTGVTFQHTVLPQPPALFGNWSSHRTMQ